MEDGISGGLQHRHKTCCEKGGHRERRACIVQRWHHCRDVVFWTGGLVYDNLAVNKDSKSFVLTAYFPSISSWDFSKKQVCNDIISQWKMTFQVSDLKEKSFLELLDSDSNPLSLSYIDRNL